MKYLVIDDHQLFFDGLKYVLREIDSDIELLYSATGEQGLRIITNTPDIDLVLLDMNLPDMKGTRLLELLRERNLSVPVVIISSSQNPIDAHNAIEYGALGFIPKTMSGEEMLFALRTVNTGKIYLPPDWQEFITTVLNSGTGLNKRLRVTPRQMDVLRLMSQGHSNKEIATDLGLTEHTVKIHVRSLLQIFNAQNRTACIHEAQRRGMLN